MAKVEPFGGSYICLICYESCRRGRGIITCTNCSVALMHQTCIGSQHRCPQCGKSTLTAWSRKQVQQMQSAANAELVHSSHEEDICNDLILNGISGTPFRQVECCLSAVQRHDGDGFGGHFDSHHYHVGLWKKPGAQADRTRQRAGRLVCLRWL